MTLALYGKSNRRRMLLAIAALLGVMVAMAGGAVLRHQTSAGAIATAALSPNGDSATYLQWTPSAGSTHSTKVDETVCSGTDYVESTGDGKRDAYTLPLSDVPIDATITSVDITLCVSQSGGGTVAPFVRSAGTNFDGTDTTSTSSSCVSKTAQNIPITPVVKAAATTLEIGVVKTAGDSSTVRLCAISAVVNFSIPLPTVTKVKAPNSDPTGGTASWNITIKNNWTHNETFKLNDAGADFVAKSPAGANCNTINNPATPITCVLTGGQIVTLTVTKPWTPSDLSYPGGNTCLDGSAKNSLTVDLSSPVQSTNILGTIVGEDITIPGSGAANCRDVTITKVRTGGGPAATFTGTLSAGTPTWSIATTTDSPNQSVTVKAPNNTNVTVTEDASGTGWTTAGFTRKSGLNATCPATFTSPNQNSITSDTNSYTICVYNTYVAPPGPNLVVAKSDDTNHAGTTGTTFHWILAVKNTGTGQARFSNGQTILTDELPSTLTYGSPTKTDGSPGIGSGDLGDISCTIAGNTLTCKATADSTDINGGEGFSVSIPVTNPAIGTYDNPRSGGTCKIDSAGVIAETNENDNNCNTDTVVVSAATDTQLCHNGNFDKCLSLLHTGTTQTVPANACFGIDANFIIDTSGSIGDGNIALLKTGLGSFVDTLGSTSKYSATRFSGDASTLTAGYVDGATFKTGISGMSSSGRTWTQGGIALGQANTANGDAARPDVMFIATDGNPNKSVNVGADPDLSDPLTWVDAANAAIDQANAARGSFWVRAVVIGTGDTNMPASFNVASWTAAVMTQIGGGSYIATPDWTQIAQGLLASTGCEPTIAKSHVVSVPDNGSDANHVKAGASFTWRITVTVPSELGQDTTISDTPPAGFTFGSPTVSNATWVTPCTVSANTLNCIVKQHTPAGTYTIDVPTTAPAANVQANCGLYTNSVSSKYGSLNLANKTDDITVEACQAPDLTVVKTPSKTDTILGQTPAETFTWTLVATNTGGQAAFTSGQQILTDTLPAAANYVLNTASPTVSGGSPAGAGGASCSLVASLLTCNASAFGATFGNGSTLTVQLTATPTAAGDLVNAAATCRVDNNNVIGETNENNNSCTSTVHVHDPSPITVVKAAAGLTGNTASWTITIDNTGTFAISHSVVVTDAGATYGGASVTGGHGSSCAPSSFPTTCTVKAGDKVVITATKDTTSIATTCNGGSISNQASYTVDGGTSHDTANPSITVPGTPGNCDRVVTICKQVSQNNDGVPDNLAGLTFSVSGNTKNGTNTVVLGGISEGGSSVCGTITVLQKDNLTITEPDLGTGWTLSDITGASTNTIGTRTATVAAGSTSPTVTYINVHTFQTRTINVCKVFEANTDGITDTFSFVAHVVETGSNVTHGPTDVTFANVAEGQSPCQQVTVAQGATVTVTEPTLPGGWGGNFDGTYPKVDIGKKPDGSSDSSYWTVRNKEPNKTRSINLCKLLNFVDDGVDEGGVFTFNLTWSGGGTANTTRTATEATSPTAVCANVTGLPQGFDITITEADSRPTNWGTDAANFPTNNAAGGGDGHKVGMVTHGADTPTVTFTNQPALQTRNIYVCKNVLANADGTNDGGAFSFTVQWPSLPSGTHSDTITRTAFENSGIGGLVTNDCGGALGVKLAIAVPKGKDVTVAEGTSRPATWSTTSNDASGFPKAKHGTDANYSAGVLASLTSPANSSDDELDFQNNHAFRSRSIQVCKVVEATDDGIESGGDFLFSITWNTGHADDLTLNVLEGASKCATVDGLPAGYDITVAEKTKPAGWVDFDNTYPKVAVGAVSPITGSSGVVPAASTSQTVTFTNKPTFQQRDLFICKNVVNNADGLDDGGAFGFTFSWTGGSGVATRTAFEHTNASPSHVTTDCGGDAGVPLAIKVPKGKDVTVTETSFAWGANNAAGFPKTGLGNPPGSLSTGTSIVSNANAVGDTAYFQNKRADQTRTLTICKTVDHNLDGTNDGGDFGFLIKDDSANQFVGGTQTRTAWEDLAQGKVITDCGTPVTILQGKSYTVSENSEPAGWQDDASLGYPKNDAAATSTFVTGASGTVPSGNGNVTVTFKNRTLDRHMNVQVCKIVASNNDNVTDGGDFRFKLTQAGAQDQTFTIANNEVQSENCVTKSVLQQVAWTVQELDARPGDANSGLNGTWNGDDSAYPQNSTDPGVKEPIAVMLSTDTKVTFTNKTNDRSHTLNVCKTVADNGDGDTTDGGSFHFVVNGGGSPNPSSFDLTVDEGKTVCQKVSVLDGFTQTVTETEPQGWVDASSYPQWATLKSDDSQLDSGSGLTSGTAGVDAAKIQFTNKARPTQSVTFIKALCTAFEDIPSNNAAAGIYTPSDMPSGYDEKDLASESPAPGVAVGSTLPADCTSVAGWTFNLFTLGNAPLGSVTTGANGKTVALTDPQMDALVSGGINVKEQTQAGYSFGALKCYTDHQFLDNSENIVLPDAGSTATEGVNCIAYNVATGSISGTKWNDLNGNGKADGGEPGLNGWTITATRKGGAPSFTTTTAGNGTYSFSDLPQGTYDVCETAQAGWTNTAPLCVEVTVGGGNNATNVDFLNFADAHIYDIKVVTNDPTDTTDFTAGITGPESFTSAGFHQHSPAKDTVTTAGDYTAKENSVAGFQYLGTVAGSMIEGTPSCPAPTPNGLSTSGATQTVTSGANIVFCHYNVAVGTVLLIKNETHQSAGSETWNFTSSVLGNPALTTAANGQTPPALSTAQTTLENVPVGSYSISETQGHNICVAGSSSTDYQTNALAAVGSVPNPDPTSNVVGAGNLSFSVQKGQQTTIVFENQGCGTVLATSSLAVKKFADPAGNFTGNTPLQGWLFTVSGTTNLGAPLLRTATTDGSGVAFFADLPDGTYTVTETLQSGWQIVGSKFVIGGSGTQAGSSRAFTIGLEENKEIDFFNQPLVSISVTKIEVTAGGTHGGQGWFITISGCGHTDTQPTDANGTVTFSNLMPCVYTVSEKVDSKPGFLPVGATTVTANATTPGANIRVGFENVKTEVCANCNTIPTPTPTTTTTPPTATPTQPAKPTTKPADPTATPTNVDITRGEKTPGPGLTPIAPNTGNGLFGTSGGSTNVLLALLGIAALGAGLIVLTAGRRKSR